MREAWTDIGDFGVVRRARLGKIDKFSQTLPHPGVDPAWGDQPMVDQEAGGCMKKESKAMGFFTG